METDSKRAAYCVQCRLSFTRTNEKAPCEGCEHNPPTLDKENLDVYELLRASTTQWKISAMGDVMGLDYNTVFKIAEILEIEIDHEKLKALQAVEWAVITKAREAKPNEQHPDTNTGDR